MSTFRISVIRGTNDNLILHDYGLRRSAWIRAMKLFDHLGSEVALDVADARANRAFERGNLVMCRRWRDLIVAIHAVEAAEPQPKERVH